MDAALVNKEYSTHTEKNAETKVTKIEIAFGGEGSLSHRFQHRSWPYVSPVKIALRRIARDPPPGLTATQELDFWGVQRHEVTLPLFYLADHQDLYGGSSLRIKSYLGKWIRDQGRSYEPRAVLIGSHLTAQAPQGAFHGVDLQYLPVEDELWPGEKFLKHDGTFQRDMLAALHAWSANRPIPEGHTRFYHGTHSEAVGNILVNGMQPEGFDPVADFGPAFYCNKKIEQSYSFAENAAIAYDTPTRGGPKTAAMMLFDVPNEQLQQLQSIVFTLSLIHI